jgi:hypothetical protein
MKVTTVTSLFLQFDALHRRIDLHRLLAHIIALGAAAGWAVHDSGDTQDLLLRLLYGVIFVMFIRLLLSRMGASRFAAALLTVLTLLLCAAFSAADMAVLCMYALVVFLVQEYFMIRTKFVAVAAALMVGVLAAAAGSHAPVILLLFVSALLSRTLWHSVVERLGKKSFVLFGIKSVGMSVLAIGICCVLGYFLTPPDSLPTQLPTPVVPWWLILIVGLPALRGAWATLLLKTDRSPKQRGLRTYYLFYGFGLLLVVWALRHHGDKVFVSTAMDKLTSAGLTDFTIAIGSFALLAAGLLISAGIDRSLYKDTRFAQAIQKQL